MPDRTAPRSLTLQLGAVGLEVETHLVDLDVSRPSPLPWDRVEPLLQVVGNVSRRAAR